MRHFTRLANGLEGLQHFGELSQKQRCKRKDKWRPFRVLRERTKTLKSETLLWPKD